VKILLFLILLFVQLFASKIVSHKVYEKDNRVDIMLTFDSEYLGKIAQKRDSKGVNLILDDAVIEKTTKKKIISPIVQTLELIPIAKGTIIRLKSDERFDVQASKTVDNYGLRLRITTSKEPKNKPLLDEDLIVNDDEDITIKTKKESSIGDAYLRVIFVLALLLGLLYLLKKWLEHKGLQSGSWLFGKDKQKIQSSQKSPIKLVQQRAIDHKNRIVLLTFRDKEYLLLLGESNVLLDKFPNADGSSDFDTELSEHEKALKEFIDNGSSADKLSSYKQKASFGG